MNEKKKEKRKDLNSSMKNLVSFEENSSCSLITYTNQHLIQLIGKKSIINSSFRLFFSSISSESKAVSFFYFSLFYVCWNNKKRKPLLSSHPS